MLPRVIAQGFKLLSRIGVTMECDIRIGAGVSAHAAASRSLSTDVDAANPPGASAINRRIVSLRDRHSHHSPSQSNFAAARTGNRIVTYTVGDLSMLRL
jgi:hypothetical protein